MCDEDHYINAVGGQVDDQTETMVLSPDVDIAQRFGYNYELEYPDTFPSSNMMDNGEFYIGSVGGFHDNCVSSSHLGVSWIRFNMPNNEVFQIS
jgi:hypothetical protein